MSVTFAVFMVVKRSKGSFTSKVLKKLLRVDKKVESEVKKDERKLAKFGRMLGPGVIAGAADDDASGIATYSTVGATTGFSLAWLMVLTTPMLIVVQDTCARLGDVTRKGLATLIRERYGLKIAGLSVLILVVANVATISADLAA